MSVDRSPKYYEELVIELLKHPNETEWVEIKKNNSNPEEIGEYISALSNSAALYGKPNAYIVWGADDQSHEIVGTNFNPKNTKKGNEELENWLLRHLSPKIHFNFYTVSFDDKTVVLLEMECAFRDPVQFKEQKFIRVGSYKKKLKDHPEKERRLWRVLDQRPFESQFAANELTQDEVIKLLDYPTFFNLLNLPLPDKKIHILDSLFSYDLISQSDSGKCHYSPGFFNIRFRSND